MNKLSNYSKIKNHPNFYQIEENIWAIKNFIPVEFSDQLVNFAESFPEETWWERNQRDWWHGKFLFNENDEIRITFDLIKSKIKELFDDNWWLSDMASIHRMQNGQRMFEHADNPTDDMGKNNFVQVSFVIYLSDFEGGEVYYPNLGIEYKPEKGDLLIHPGTSRYTHGVKEVVGDKTRYVTTCFAYDPKVKELRDQGLVFENVETGEPILDYEDTERAVLDKR